MTALEGYGTCVSSRMAATAAVPITSELLFLDSAKGE
jgi:hypothetical protein